METAEDKYPSIIEYVRMNLGLKADDTSKDDIIMEMPRREIFRRFLTWKGIIGYDDIILNAVSEIYEVDLEGNPE